MRILIAFSLISLLTSCATTAYNRSYIMGDNRVVESSKETISAVEKSPYWID